MFERSPTDESSSALCKYFRRIVFFPNGDYRSTDLFNNGNFFSKFVHPGGMLERSRGEAERSGSSNKIRTFPATSKAGEKGFSFFTDLIS